MLRVIALLALLLPATAYAGESSEAPFKASDIAGNWRAYFFSSYRADQMAWVCILKIKAGGAVGGQISCTTIDAETGRVSGQFLDRGKLTVQKNGRVRGNLFFGAGGLAKLSFTDVWMSRNGDVIEGIGRIAVPGEMFLISAVRR